MVKRLLIGLGLASFASLPVLSREYYIEEDSVLTKEAPIELREVKVMGRSKIRKLQEVGMPVSVLGQRQLEGTANNINDVLAHATGITVRNTGGVGSASRVSVRGLEGKRMGMMIAPIKKK